jgi:hypothetical protein
MRFHRLLFAVHPARALAAPRATLATGRRGGAGAEQVESIWSGGCVLQSAGTVLQATVAVDLVEGVPVSRST